jgi:hypothetical protein
MVRFDHIELPSGEALKAWLDIVEARRTRTPETVA